MIFERNSSNHISLQLEHWTSSFYFSQVSTLKKLKIRLEFFQIQ